MTAEQFQEILMQRMQGPDGGQYAIALALMFHTRSQQQIAEAINEHRFIVSASLDAIANAITGHG